MSVNTLLHTIRYLKPTQIFYQLKYRIARQRYKAVEYDLKSNIPVVKEWCDKITCNDGNTLTFIGISDSFKNWSDTGHGMLWVYNLNYMDWLNQPGMTFEDGAAWIDRFINDLPANSVGLDPYPIALRGLNWIKFMTRYNKLIDGDTFKRWNNSLYSQYHLLSRTLEYHLLANHLLEDLFSLYIASIYFGNEQWRKNSHKLLVKELNRQILPDGAHFEQSPMYHCILLDRLLDCINWSGSKDISLIEPAQKMLGHLESITLSNGMIPHLNDSADNIAPLPMQIFNYARTLGLEWGPIPMKECGYRRLNDGSLDAIVDIGNITATYQPGHTHADTFTYELFIDGKPFIIDTGISTYEKNARRQHERSTCAHNTVSIDGLNSSDVWSGFRIGKRANVSVIKDTPCMIQAAHDGFGKKKVHTRDFSINPKRFTVIDNIQDNSGISYIHFAPDVKIHSHTNEVITTDMAVIVLRGAKQVDVIEDYTSTRYNELQKSLMVKIYFSGSMTYSINI